MVCFKGCVLLLCLVAINGATLRDLFNRPNYEFSDRTEADDNKFWQNYDRLIEGYEADPTEPPCVPEGEGCMIDEQCDPMCPTGGPGFCDTSKNPSVCIPDGGGGPFRDMNDGFERSFSNVRT